MVVDDVLDSHRETLLRLMAESIERSVAMIKGGEGSGNFGHEGRPGEVGGSGPGGKIVLKQGKNFYHVTHEDNVASILKNGLLPNQEKYANDYPNDVEGVFLATDIDQAKVIRDQLDDNSGEKVHKILEVYMPKGKTVYIDSSMPESAVVSTEKIHQRHIRVLSSAVKGGEGSGNFGHEGRPGEVGGSGPGGGVESGLEAVAKNKAFAEKHPYLYHITSESNVNSISKEGLKPSKSGYQGKGLYFATSPEGTEYYHRVGEKGSALLRVRTENVLSQESLYPHGKLEHDSQTGEVIHQKKVPASWIEIQKDGKWVRLNSVKSSIKASTDYSSRTEDERKMKAAILAVLDDFKQDFIDAGGEVDAYFWNKMAAAVENAVAGQLKETSDASAKELADALGIDYGTDVKDSITRWADEYARTLAEDVVSTSKDMVGAGSDSTTEDLADSVFGESRAETIGVTETTSAISKGAAALAVDQELNGTWVTEHDDLVCEECDAMDGMETDQLPPLHPNCRCYIAYH